MALGLSAEAFERLFEELERPVYNVVYRWLWSAEEASDVVQEAFVRLWAMRRRVELQTVRPLVYRIALNLASSRLRRTRRHATPTGWGGGATHDIPEEAMLREEGARRVRAALDQLPEGHRAVVVLCELSQLSYAEVARTLDIKVGTVGSRRNAAMARMRRWLEASGEAPDVARP